MNFSSQIFFIDMNHGYRAAILKKSSLWLLPFYMAVATNGGDEKPKNYVFIVNVKKRIQISDLPRTQSEYRKIRTRNNSVFGLFSRSE